MNNTNLIASEIRQQQHPSQPPQLRESTSINDCHDVEESNRRECTCDADISNQQHQTLTQHHQQSQLLKSQQQYQRMQQQ